MVEVIIAVTILALVVPVLTLLFSKVRQGFAADEMHTLLKKNNQEVMNRIHIRLESCKRIFQNDGVGPNFKGLIPMGSLPVAATSTLPLIQPGSLSPTQGGVAANYGNTLFFAAYDAPQTILNQAAHTYTAYPAPVTLNNVLDSGGQPNQLIIDVYRFYLYYLTAANPHNLVGVTTYALEEVQSVQYPDYQELQAYYLTDTTLAYNAVSMMSASGFVTLYDTSQNTTNTAFYQTVHTAGVTWTLNVIAAPVIQIAQSQDLTLIHGGILSSGFRYGISPNSAGWKDAPAKVPHFGTVAGTFPGGFEIGLGGTSAGRSVMIRSVLVAQGAAPRVAYNDQVVTTNARDVW